VAWGRASGRDSKIIKSTPIGTVSCLSASPSAICERHTCHPSEPRTRHNAGATRRGVTRACLGRFQYPTQHRERIVRDLPQAIAQRGQLGWGEVETRQACLGEETALFGRFDILGVRLAMGECTKEGSLQKSATPQI